MKRHPIRHLSGALAGLVLAVLTVAGPLGSPSATARGGGEPPALTVAGAGAWHVRPWINDAVVDGVGQLRLRNGRQTDVQVAAVVQPDDRTLPGPGECEHAFATMTVYDARRIAFTMVGSGDVCGRSPQPPTSIVTHVFTGRYEVYGEDTSPKRLLGTDGFYEVRLAENGTAGVFAIDT